MEGERYRVVVEFEGGRLVPGESGRRVSMAEALLPDGSSVRVVNESVEDGIRVVEFYVTATHPSMALRDVARAMEMVGVTSVAGKKPDVVRATVVKASEATPQGDTLESR
jgi:hypothetical protein